MAKLPEPTVTANTVPNPPSGHAVGVKISRDGKERSYLGTGADHDAAVADAVRQIIVDPHTSEYVP